MSVRGIRGATTVANNTKENIIDSTFNLLREMITLNNVEIFSLFSLFSVFGVIFSLFTHLSKFIQSPKKFFLVVAFWRFFQMSNIVTDFKH